MIFSYAQNFEDVILWRALHSVVNGTYIDIGAQHPIHDSVSHTFYQHGWRGIHVEPVPSYAEMLRNERPDERVIEAAVTSAVGPLKFYEFPETGLSTSLLDLANNYAGTGRAPNILEVDTISLADIFNIAGGPIHWLKIDVEGMEASVLSSWKSEVSRPWVVLVESTVPTSRELNHYSWEPELHDRDYEFVYFDGLNRFYLHRSKTELKDAFGPGPNIFDEFALTEHSTFNGPLVANHQAAIKAVEVSHRDQADLEKAHLKSKLKAASRHTKKLENKISRLRAGHLRARLALNNAREASNKSADHLASREASWSSSLSAAQKQIYRLVEEIPPLVQQISKLETAREQNKKMVCELHLKIKLMKDTLEIQKASLEEVINARDALYTQMLHEIKQRDERWEAMSALLEEQKLRSQNRLTEALNLESQMQSELNAIRNSRSWVLSAPVRFTGKIIRQCRARSGVFVQRIHNMFRSTPTPLKSPHVASHGNQTMARSNFDSLPEEPIDCQEDRVESLLIAGKQHSATNNGVASTINSGPSSFKTILTQEISPSIAPKPNWRSMIGTKVSQWANTKNGSKTT